MEPSQKKERELREMTTFALKMTALVLMVLDHVGLYFEPLLPPWLFLLLRLVGRGSFPLFLFCMVQGYAHTHSRRAYLLRLYAGSLFMTAFALGVDHLFPTEGFGYGNHNIFLSMLLVGALISTLETVQHDRKKGLWMIAGIFGVQVLYFAVSHFVPFVKYSVSGDILTGIIPNLALNEYGLEFVILGVAMYFLRDRKDLFAAMYLLFCAGQFAYETVWGDWGFPIQFAMVLSLPLMLRYNGEKGRGTKWFFYIFYPAHTFLLFCLANFVVKC